MFKKRLSVLVLFCLVSSIFVANVFAEPSETSETSNSLTMRVRNVNKTADNVKISAQIPVVSVSGSNNALNNSINDSINSLYLEKLAESKKIKATSLDLSYQRKDSKDIVSILITTTTTVSSKASARNYLDVINVDLKNNKILTLNDVLGVNSKAVADRFIAKQISKTPEKYSQDFKGVKDNQDFYLESDLVTIVFDKFEIASGTEDIVTFQIDPAKIKNYTLDKSNYYAKDTYDLKMLPVREISEAFGYSVRWIPELSAIDLRRTEASGEKFLSEIKLKLNSYYKNPSSKKPLESSPEISNGVTYLPVSYFTEILSLDYTIAEDESITFSEYLF